MAKVNCVNKDRTLVYGVLLLQSFTFSVLAYGAILEELSNQRRSKNIGDEEETKETEPDVLQRQWNKGAKKRRERDHARCAAQTVSERQATSQWKSTRERGTEVQRYGTLKEVMKM